MHSNARLLSQPVNMRTHPAAAAAASKQVWLLAGSSAFVIEFGEEKNYYSVDFLWYLNETFRALGQSLVYSD